MKKILAFMLLFVLAFSVISCEKNADLEKEPKTPEYKSYISDVANDEVSRNLPVDVEYALYPDIEAPIDRSNKTGAFLGKTYEGSYQCSMRIGDTSLIVDQYRTENGLVFYLQRDTGSLVGIYTPSISLSSGTILVPHQESDDLQKTALSMAEALANQYLSNIEEYEIQIKKIPAIVKGGEDLGYTVRYVKKIQGIETTDYFAMAIDAEGKFLSMGLGELNGFDDFEETIQMNENAVCESISKKVKEIYAEGIYQYKSHEIKSQILCKTIDGKYGIHSTVFVTIASGNDELETGLDFITVLE